MKIQKIRNNKKGISPVIATILLILITVASVAIVWVAVKPLITDNLNTMTLCPTESQIQIETSNGKTCYRTNSKGGSTNSNVSIQLKKSPGTKSTELIDAQIILTDSDGNTISKRISKDNLTTNNVMPGDNEAKMYVLSANNKTITNIAIAPIVKNGNTEKTCDAGQAIKLPTCL